MIPYFPQKKLCIIFINGLSKAKCVILTHCNFMSWAKKGAACNPWSLGYKCAFEFVYFINKLILITNIGNLALIHKQPNKRQ